MLKCYQATPAHIESAPREAGGVDGTSVQGESAQSSPHPVLGGRGCERIRAYSIACEFAPESAQDVCEAGKQFGGSGAGTKLPFLAFFSSLS